MLGERWIGMGLDWVGLDWVGWGEGLDVWWWWVGAVGFDWLGGLRVAVFFCLGGCGDVVFSMEWNVWVVNSSQVFYTAFAQSLACVLEFAVVLSCCVVVCYLVSVPRYRVTSESMTNPPTARSLARTPLFLGLESVFVFLFVVLLSTFSLDRFSQK